MVSEVCPAKHFVVVIVVHSLSHVWLFVTTWTVACQASLSFTISQTLLKLMTVESMMPSKHLILCHPLLLLPSIFPSIRVFSWISSSPQVAEVLELQHQSFQWLFRISSLQDWLVGSPCSPRDSQGVFSHHSSKASILQHSAPFMVHLSHLYMDTGKTIAFII